MPEVDREKERAADAARKRRCYAGEREKILARNAAWKKANPEKKAELDAAYYQANRERLDARATARRLANPEPGRARSRARRHLVRAGGGDRIDPRSIFERDEGICGICKQPVPPDRYEIDHIIPISRGGRHVESNLQTAHVSCNRRKGARI